MAIEERYVTFVLLSRWFLTHQIYRPVTNADYPSLEKIAESAIKERQKFERLLVSKETLLEMFGVSAGLSAPCFVVTHVPNSAVQQVQEISHRD